MDYISAFLFRMRDSFISILKTGNTFIELVDILFIAFLTYQGIKLLKETRAMQLVKGILALLATSLVAYVLKLTMTGFVLNIVLQIGAFALVVLFQPELRRMLEQVGRSKISSLSVFGSSSTTDQRQLFLIRRSITAVCDACASMSKKRVGALIVFERKTRLGEIINTGTIIDADPSIELIRNVFFPNSPLHDGAMIIREGKIYAAGCFLPLSDNHEISRELGTRHRAALGMSENSDAIVVVVSEENGIISVMQDGRISRNYSYDALALLLKEELLGEHDLEKQDKKPVFWKVRK